MLLHHFLTGLITQEAKKTPLDRKEISCPYALYESIRIIVYLQNLNTFHIRFCCIVN